MLKKALVKYSFVKIDRAHTQRVKSSPRRSWFITERITVFTDFGFEKLRSADADVTGI